MLTIEEVRDEYAARGWDDYVMGQPDATCYHLLLWQRVAQRAYGMRAPFLIARDGRGVRGVLPLFLVRRPLQPYLVSGMFGAYGRILADDSEVAHGLVEGARALMGSVGAAALVIKSVGDEPALRAAGFERHDPYVYATLALPRDPQGLWRGFRDKTRNSVRKALRSDLVARWGAEHLPALYDILAANMHRKGTPIYGARFMRELVTALGDRAEVLTLWRRSGGCAVSAALLVYHDGVLAVPFASSRPGTFHMNPNNLLYWEIMQRGIVRGAHTLDFGRSVRGATTLAFKKGWGAAEHPHPVYVYGRPQRFDGSSGLIRGLVRLWQRLPRPVADVIGPPICQRVLV